MPIEPFWPSFRADLQRHFVYHPNLTTKKKVQLALTVDGIWAMAVYRFGRAVKTRPHTPLRALQSAAHIACEVALRFVSGIHLDVDARIAPGFYIGHFGSIYVGPGVEIGPCSSIGQLCFVGAAEPGGPAPRLGAQVYLGAGCKVLGPVNVADGAAVGANAVVLEDVPERAVVAGVPAQVVSRKGSADFIYLGQGAAPAHSVASSRAREEARPAFRKVEGAPSDDSDRALRRSGETH